MVRNSPLGPLHVSGVLNLGNRTKDAGGAANGMVDTLSGELDFA